MAKKQSKAKVPRWKQALIGIAAGLTAIGGGSGIAALSDAVHASPPTTTTEQCDVYWGEIHQLKKDGFTGFGLMHDPELEARCGKAADVANDWP